ncbi:YihY/virulence factor BrkB family protein [Mangrovibrevibacter kandeliae]|uniref:YihY/virulence factor BrkB family protein n=1 Tax=Mangrovibrevibacter kandeliae TaxID=2968473 RepID=UPI0021181B9E|nr:YihY/virulence factor BrkB family protein [Aurantimonas sp. CSK15Z-1]MCQ8783317.1 YihY/virulence factor BrkB family protein [Aurantimonas sp. CSK15Z-1]
MTDAIDIARSHQQGRGRQAQRPSDIPRQGWKDIFWRLWGEISDDRVMLVAAGVTYYILLAFVPGLTATISMYGLVADPHTIAEQVSMLQGIVPGGALDILNDQLNRLTQQNDSALSFAFVVSILIALWSANSGMKSLFEAMNVAYDQKETRSFVKLTLTSFVFTLGLIAMILAMVVLVVVLPPVLDFLGFGNSAQWLVQIASFAVLFLMLSLGIAALYRWGPNRQNAKWRWITPGTILSLLLTLVVSVLFSWYSANFGSYNATYGSLGALIGFMTWMWLSNTIVIVGGELNSELEHQTAEDTTTGAPQPMGSRGATMADSVGQASSGDAASGLGPGGKGAKAARQRAEVERLERDATVAVATLAVALPAALIVSLLRGGKPAHEGRGRRGRAKASQRPSLSRRDRRKIGTTITAPRRK